MKKKRSAEMSVTKNTATWRNNQYERNFHFSDIELPVLQMENSFAINLLKPYWLRVPTV